MVYFDQNAPATICIVIFTLQIHNKLTEYGNGLFNCFML